MEELFDIIRAVRQYMKQDPFYEVKLDLYSKKCLDKDAVNDVEAFKTHINEVLSKPHQHITLKFTESQMMEDMIAKTIKRLEYYNPFRDEYVYVHEMETGEPYYAGDIGFFINLLLNRYYTSVACPICKKQTILHRYQNIQECPDGHGHYLIIDHVKCGVFKFHHQVRYFIIRDDKCKEIKDQHKFEELLEKLNENTFTTTITSLYKYYKRTGDDVMTKYTEIEMKRLNKIGKWIDDVMM